MPSPHPRRKLLGSHLRCEACCGRCENAARADRRHARGAPRRISSPLSAHQAPPTLMFSHRDSHLMGSIGAKNCHNKMGDAQKVCVAYSHTWYSTPSTWRTRPTATSWFFQERRRFEADRPCPVAPRPPQAQHDSAVRRQLQRVLGDGRTQYVPAQMFAPLVPRLAPRRWRVGRSPRCGRAAHRPW